MGFAVNIGMRAAAGYQQSLKVSFDVATIEKRRVHSARGSVMSIPITYCQTCHVLRAIRNWSERDDTLMIELEPCGHVACKNARLEWSTRRAVA